MGTELERRQSASDSFRERASDVPTKLEPIKLRVAVPRALRSFCKNLQASKLDHVAGRFSSHLLQGVHWYIPFDAGHAVYNYNELDRQVESWKRCT